MKRKLIEVALPLPEINDASAYDKMPGIGPHPKGIHHWWARLPLPAARAVLFASVVDDPSADPDRWPTEEAQKAERERLFDIIRRMMGKKLHEHPEVYSEARAEMLKNTGSGEALPVVFDPFAGGGSIPLEANRLGFEAHAGDLNPVAVLLNKCCLELTPRWAERAQVNPKDRMQIGGEDSPLGTRGLAADVRYYARLIHTRVRERTGHLYPKARLPKEFGGGEADVIAWVWARTVASPDPAARGVHVPLVSTFWLSTKKGGEARLEPVIDKAKRAWYFEIRTGAPQDRAAAKRGTRSGAGGFACILTGTPIPFDYIQEESAAGRLRLSLVAVVAGLPRVRVYLPATRLHEEAAAQAAPSGFPDTEIPEEALGFRVQRYGIRKHWQMFSPRQLTTIVALSDLVRAVRLDVHRDAQAAGFVSDEADDYARVVTTFLALAVDRCADFNNALCRWSPSNQKVMNLFGRPAIPMIWDFAEANTLADSVGSWRTCSEYVAECIEVMTGAANVGSEARQIDAATGADGLKNLLVSTDPPYYDNIGYAALSDFFYVWLRRTIGDLYPDLFSTVLVPKMKELTAAPERFDGDKQKAKEHFESGFRRSFTALREKLDPRFPLSVYYAFKQADEEGGGDGDDADSAPGVDLTTGWETLLEALIASGFQITGTWPIRASQAWRMRAMGSNALTSYIVLACRTRPGDAPLASRKEFVAALKKELPEAFRRLQHGNVAPVDLAQASVGPGMAVYSRYSKVVEPSGDRLSVRTALGLINQALDEVLSEQEAEFDPGSRWALAWFAEYGMNEGPYGTAETLSKAKDTAISALVEDGMLEARKGKVRLLSRDELRDDWDPASDKRLTVWEVTQHLIRRLLKAGEASAAELLGRVGGYGETAKDLAYRLFSICDKKSWAQEAGPYNSLVTSWPELMKLAAKPAGGERQAEMFNA